MHLNLGIVKFPFSRSAVGLRPCISRKPPGDAEIASQEGEAGWGTGGARCACVERLLHFEEPGGSL